MSVIRHLRQRWTGRRIFIAAIVALIVLAGAAVIVNRANQIFSDVVISDCQWTGTATAWVDANSNAVRDADETPLKDVHFFVDDVHNQYPQVGSGTSDGEGNAALYVFIAGCPETNMEVYPQVPEDYCLTTTERLAENAERQYAFGFRGC